MDWPLRLCTTRLLDQHFGMCIMPEDLLIPFTNKQGKIYYRPWKLCEELANKDFGSTIDNTNDKLKISLDVQHFKPNEISVKTNDKEVIIEGKHEERSDEHGFISRQFVRRYALPKDCITESVTSTLSADGVLSIIAKKKGTKEIQESAKIIPITMTASSRQTEGSERKMAAVSTKMDKGEREQKACERKASQKTEDKIKKETKNECQMKKACKDECEMKKETKSQCEMKTGVKDKKETQLMLKEEHCRLLRPELLAEAASSLNTEKLIAESRKETDELMKLITGDTNIMMSAAADKIDEVIGQCKTAINELKKDKAEAMSMMSEMSSMAESEMISTATSEMSKMSASEMLKMAAPGISKMVASEMSQMAASGMSKMAASEMSQMSASEMSKMSASEMTSTSTSEKSKMAASEISKMSASEMSSMAASEMSSSTAASEMTRMATSEMSSIKSSVISETVEVTMSSSSSKTTSEATSEIISEKIRAELRGCCR